MELILISFFAGALTILSPCTFTLLPVILGGSILGKEWRKPFVIIASLALSIFIFTLLLKASTLLIMLDPSLWRYISGGILLFFGIVNLYPQLWDSIQAKMQLSNHADQLINKGSAKGKLVGDILVGAALGPVFTSCSPTYSLLVVTVLPQTPAVGMINLLAYVVGLALPLLAISIFGQSILRRFSWAANPQGIFRKVVGVIFLLVGLAVLTGIDKRFESYLLDIGTFNAILVI